MKTLPLPWLAGLLLAGCAAVPEGSAPRVESPAQVVLRYEAEYRQGSVSSGLRSATM